MRVFAQERKPDRQDATGAFSMPASTFSNNASAPASSLQHAVGNQAVQRLVRGDGLAGTTIDASRNPTCSKGGEHEPARGEPIVLPGEEQSKDPEAEEQDGMSSVGRAEVPADFVGPLQPGDTRAVPFDFVGPLEPGVARSSAFHPTMTVVTPGTAVSDCGAFTHKVRWGIPAVVDTASGWVVQKVDIRFNVTDCANNPVTPHAIDDPANYPFWEAWEFTSGGNVWVGPASGGTAHSGDTFSGSDYGPGTKGSISLIGEVKAIEGFTLPAGMTVRNTFPAWSLPYTTSEPAQFGSTLAGAAHVVTAQWNCCPSGTVTRANTVTATP